MPKIKPQPEAELDRSYNHTYTYFAGGTFTELQSDELLEVGALEIVRLAPAALIVPQGCDDRFLRIDTFIHERLKALVQDYTLVHPAYIESVKTYTHLFDAVLGQPFDSWSGLVRFDGAHFQAESNLFYTPRPLVGSLARGERGDWSSCITPNYMQSYTNDEVDHEFLQPALKEAGIALENVSDTEEILVSFDYTCVIKKQ